MPLSPMMQQYLSIKEKHKQHIVFFRLGDFYEMFFDDAILASKELELTLTGRDCGLEERAPMCGVPYHSCDAYIARLVKKGYKVAICEQLEDPATAKGVVKRDITRIITPGTVIESNLLDEGVNNYICSIFCKDTSYGLSFADISTGEVYVTQFEDEADTKIINELSRFMPSEIIYNKTFLEKKQIAEFIKQKLHCIADPLKDEVTEQSYAKEVILKHFENRTLKDLKIDVLPLAICSLGGLLSYLNETQRIGVQRMIDLHIYSEQEYMNINYSAQRNLELKETMITRDKKGSLLWVLDKTKTAMGKRLIRTYIDKPLMNPTYINKRLNAVEELFTNSIKRDEIANILAGIFDLERLMTRIIFGNASPRELKSLEQTTFHLPALKQVLKDVKAQNLTEIRDQIDELQDVYQLIFSAIDPKTPITLKDGGVIKDGFNKELDELRKIVVNTKEVLTDIETREREKTGIKGLKVGYNRVFGYYFEVTRSYLELVPETYIRKQTLTNCERYITEELKKLEEEILGAHDKILALEAKLFNEVRDYVSKQLNRVQITANAIARLDVYLSLAQVAFENNYTRPYVNMSDRVFIKDGRHPVVEKILHGVPFVPNDVDLNNKDKLIAIITGPNMAGKSTYMRQTALIILMAQIGSFVPAVSAEIGIVDGIYTRVGASDDIGSGKSTFMVEMSEMADILKHATSRSFLILDEIGRGTSTFDGMSLARAIIEYICDPNKLGAKTMFATHYHELTEMENILSSIKNYNIAVKKRGDDIIFLRRIVPGGADESYGIEVSKLAGVPDWIIKRARSILKALENEKEIPNAKRKTAKPQETTQLSFEHDIDSRIVDALNKIDLNTLSPIEALNTLYQLKSMI